MQGIAFALVTLTAASFVLTDYADARTRRHRVRAAAAKVERYSPPYAAIVVDANSGVVLYSDSPDSPRHPASLTKIMTLYLLFERLEAGKITLATPLPVSEHAAVQAPSKLALKPGETISVENAIRAIVTKSANDVAVVVAEALGGSEDEFARMMTKKARELGMTHTGYVNASGLPNDDQITTARDQVILGRAIQERFPKYYRYFSTPSFAFRGHSMRNHNRLLGQVEGVDGIKTGYTNASGFNLVTSMRRGGRHVVAAVFGGRTANWRDARMRELIGKYIQVASIEKKNTVLASAKAAPAPETTKLASGAPMQIISSAEAAPAPAVAAAPVAPPAVTSGPHPGSTEPIKPNAVKTVKVKPTKMQALGVASLPASDAQLAPPATTGNITTVTTVNSANHAVPPAAMAYSATPAPKPNVLGTLPVRTADAQNGVPADSKVNAKTRVTGGYLIQVGAFPDEGEAKARLATARKVADILGRADPFTEKVEKGDKTLYRARFAGFDRDQAENACKQLKRGEIPCMLLKN